MLMSKALYNQKCQQDVLTTHEANTLYACREQLRLGGSELRLLWRSLLSDGSNLMPGWYWHKASDTNATEIRIYHMGMYDSKANIRARAIQIMGDMKLIPDEKLWGEIDVLDQPNPGGGQVGTVYMLICPVTAAEYS